LWDEGPETGGPFGPYRQSERRENHLKAWQRLRDGGFIYPCRRSRKDVATAPTAPHEKDPIFPIRWRANPDIAMAVTEVIRGADLLTSTARQILLYRALQASPPSFAHCPLFTDANGRRLAKRENSLRPKSQSSSSDEAISRIPMKSLQTTTLQSNFRHPKIPRWKANLHLNFFNNLKTLGFELSHRDFHIMTV